MCECYKYGNKGPYIGDCPEPIKVLSFTFAPV